MTPGRLKAGVTAEMDATARRTKRAAERTATAVPDALDAKVSETRSAATGVAGAVEGPLTGLEAYIWGQHAGSAFAQGLASQTATTEAAAQRARRGDPCRHRLLPAATVRAPRHDPLLGTASRGHLARRASSATSATSSGPPPGSRVP